MLDIGFKTVGLARLQFFKWFFMYQGIDAPARFGSSTLLSMSVILENNFIRKIQTP
jgi:hypothetical protein